MQAVKREEIQFSAKNQIFSGYSCSIQTSRLMGKNKNYTKDRESWQLNMQVRNVVDSLPKA